MFTALTSIALLVIVAGNALIYSQEMEAKLHRR